MIRPFNLAQSRIAERRYCQQHIGMRLKMVALFLVLILLAAAVSYACKAMITDKASAAKFAAADAQSKSAAMKRRITAMESELNERKWQNQLTTSSKRWLSVMNSIFECLPQDMWLNHVENSSKDTSVTIDGNASSFESLSVFVESLRARPVFSEVHLVSTRTGNTGSGSCVTFSIGAKANMPDKTTPAASPSQQQSGSVPRVGGN